MKLGVTLDILNQKDTPAFFADVLANRPAAGFTGRIFVDTNVPSTGLYRDTGSSWIQIADQGAGTTGTLQQVTTNGNTTSQGINITAGGLSSNIVTIAENGLGSTTNYIGQTMATNDNWKIFGTGSNSDQGEMVFQVGDNGLPFPSNGQRFRFSYDATSGGTSKDSFIIDYDLSYFNTSLGINTDTPTAAFDVHSGVSVIAQLNQTVATNNSLLAFQNAGAGLWRIGNFYNAGANDFSIFDVIGSIQPITIKKTTGQVLIGTSTIGSGKLVVSSTTSDNGIQIVGANAPSLRIDNAESGATKRAGLGISTAANNFIQGSADRDFCMFNGSTTSSPILFGIYDTTNVQEAARISAARNFIVGKVTDSGERLQISGTASITGQTNIGNANTSTTQLILRNGGGASRIAYLTQIGTNASSTDITWYNGVNVFSTDASFEIKNAAGNGITIKPSTANILINTNIDSGEKLQVNGSSLFSGQATFSNFVFANSLRINGLDTANTIYIGSSNMAITAEPGYNISIGRVSDVTRAINVNTTNGNLLIGTTTNGGSKLKIVGLPTSAVGLSSGDVYSNAGILTIVP